MLNHEVSELALERDVAPIAQIRLLVDLAQQIGTSQHAAMVYRGLMDEVDHVGHRSLGGVVVRFVCPVHIQSSAPPFSSLLIQLTDSWLAALKQLLGVQLLPTGIDHWVNAEKRHLAWCDLAGGRGCFKAFPWALGTPAQIETRLDL